MVVVDWAQMERGLHSFTYNFAAPSHSCLSSEYTEETSSHVSSQGLSAPWSKGSAHCKTPLPAHIVDSTHHVQETRELPTPAADEVQIAVQSTGLCGSDLHYYNHYRNGDIIVREPLTLGHESSGLITAVGSSVSDLKAGDRVALEVGLPCESCEYCDAKRYNICRQMKFRSSAKAVPHAQGTLQERINHPARWCHKLPADLSLDLGALIEPLSVAMHGHSRANLPSATSILVLGAGAVGLLVAAVAKANGHERVVIADIQKDRVDFATANGFADAGVVVPMARPEGTEAKLTYAKEVAELVKTTKVGGTDVGEVGAVFECTGVETCLQSSIYVSALGCILKRSH